MNTKKSKILDLFTRNWMTQEFSLYIEHFFAIFSRKNTHKREEKSICRILKEMWFPFNTKMMIIIIIHTIMYVTTKQHNFQYIFI